MSDQVGQLALVRAIPKDGRPEAEQAILLVSESGIDRVVFGDILSGYLPGVRLQTLDDAREMALADLEPDRFGLILFADHALRPEGAAKVRAVRSRHPLTRVGVFGMVGTVEAGEWIRAGVDGVLSQRLSPHRFADALRFLLAGNRYISPEIFEQPSSETVLCSPQGICERLLSLLEELPAPLFLVRDGQVIHANRAAGSDLNLRDVPLLGRPFTDVVSPSGREALKAALTTGERSESLPPPLLLPLSVGQARPRWFELHWSRVGQGAEAIFCCVCLDQSERIDTAAPAAISLMPASGPVGKRGSASAKREPGGGRQDAAWQGHGRLTHRQREVLVLLAQGRTNREIALELNIAEVTAKLHVHRIFRVLKVKNRTEAALIARNRIPGGGAG